MIAPKKLVLPKFENPRHSCPYKTHLPGAKLLGVEREEYKWFAEEVKDKSFTTNQY